MVQIAVSSATRVGYLLETTENVIPATPIFQTLRVTSESLEVKRTAEQSQELDSNRNVADSVLTSAEGTGALNYEFSATTFEDLLACAMRQNWVADQLVNGTVQKTLAVEVEYTTAVVYKRFTGAQISKMKIDFKPKSIITGSFDVLSRGTAYDNATIAGATYTAPTTTPIMTGGLDFAGFSMAGLTIDCVPMLSMEIDNNLRTLWCLNGSLDPNAISSGDFTVKGDIEFYLDANKYAILQAFIANTATSLNFTVGRTTLLKTSFEMPNVRFSEATVASQGKNNDVLIKAKWQAHRAPTTAFTVPITGEQATMRVTRHVV